MSDPCELTKIHMIQWWQFRQRAHCSHRWTIGIYGDLINEVGGWRNRCVACSRYLDGPVSISDERDWLKANADSV